MNTFFGLGHGTSIGDKEWLKWHDSIPQAVVDYPDPCYFLGGIPISMGAILRYLYYLYWSKFTFDLQIDRRESNSSSRLLTSESNKLHVNFWDYYLTCLILNKLLTSISLLITKDNWGYSVYKLPVK